MYARLLICFADAFVNPSRDTDVSYFRSKILTPDHYVDMAKEMYDYGKDADDFPSYMSMYDTVCAICKEQCSIIDEGTDLLLSSFSQEHRLLISLQY